MKTIRFAILGCGNVSRKHLAALERIPGAEATAVCDLSPIAAKRTGEQHNLPYYTDPHEMLKKHNVDVVSILTPSGSHASNILDLFQYGVNFLVEKPLTLRLEDADEIINSCYSVDSKIYVVQQNRYNRPITKLKQAIDAGRFGKLVMGTVRVRWCRRQDYYDACDWRGTWSLDGGVFTNQASHHIDMLCWLMGEVESVKALIATRLAHIEAEDTGAAVVRFANGALGVIEATTATRPRDQEGSISILGEKGTVVVGGFFMNKLMTWDFEKPMPEDEEVFKEWGENPNEFAWNHTQYLQGIVQNLRDGTKGLVEGLEARKSLELINAIYESAESGKEVFLRFKPKYCKLGVSSNEKL